MPHLQFETTVDLTQAGKRAFAGEITTLYADLMATGTGHVAVTLRTLADGELSLGRLDRNEDAVMLNADIRRGRSFDQQRQFVLAAFDAVRER